MLRFSALFAIAAAIVICTSVADTRGQVGAASEPAVGTTAERIYQPPIGDIVGPPDWLLLVGPFGPAFNPPVSNTPFNVTPTLSIREEYNDNVFLDNRNRRADFISALTPGVRV